VERANRKVLPSTSEGDLHLAEDTGSGTRITRVEVLDNDSAMITIV